MFDLPVVRELTSKALSKRAGTLLNISIFPESIKLTARPHPLFVIMLSERGAFERQKSDLGFFQIPRINFHTRIYTEDNLNKSAINSDK